MSVSILTWVLFSAAVLFFLILDLAVFNRKAHAIQIKESLLLCLFWVSLASIFGTGVYFKLGSEKAIEFFAGYLVEYSLSVDNLFVFVLIFTYFKVPREYQHKLLFWGIIGAVILRLCFILTGVALIQKFHWMIYIFGVFLIFTGFKMLTREEEQVHPDKNWVVRGFRRLMPVTPDYEGSYFFVRREGKLWATPLFVALLVVESSDLIFAVDSIPAIFGITLDPFIVFSSNVFAILGLRSLYFALSGLLRIFHYLEHGVSLILMYVGVKMLISNWFHIPVWITLLVIIGILIGAILLSLFLARDKKK